MSNGWGLSKLSARLVGSLRVPNIAMNYLVASTSHAHLASEVSQANQRKECPKLVESSQARMTALDP